MNSKEVTVNLFDYIDQLREQSGEPGAYVSVKHETEPDPRLLPELAEDLKPIRQFATEDDRPADIRWAIEIAPSWADGSKRDRVLTITTDRSLNVLGVEVEGTTGAYVKAALAIAVSA